MHYRTIAALSRLLSIGLAIAACLFAQTAARRGMVQGSLKDSTGGIIPGATVTLTSSSGAAQTTTTGGDGTYTFRGVDPGSYTVTAKYTGLEPVKPLTVSVTAGQTVAANIVMTIQEQKQEVTVSDTSDNHVSTESSNNATQLVLKQEDLDALPDDPDDLQADLQALAGPSAGPGGNQIYVDGFTNGRLPPKESIREIRINSNPFSAEFDKLGYGRIQIFTKPGSDKFHGQGYFNISDSIWNSRNPFLTVNPPFRTELFGGNVSGPLGKHASFFIDVERRNIDDNGIITATIPTANFTDSGSYQSYYATPQRRTTVSPRVDYQLGANNTLSFRYAYLDNEKVVSGIGGFDLPGLTLTGPGGDIALASAAYSTASTQQSFQIVETAVLNPKVVNEMHFEFDREITNEASKTDGSQLDVSQSFVAGGSGYSAPGFSKTYDKENDTEFQNYTSVTWGAHVTKFGVRVRTDALDNSSPQNFNGIYEFLGGSFPQLNAALQPTGATVQLKSIQQYITTVQLLNTGLSSAQVSAMGYGPSKYTVSTGNPYLSFYQMDFGPFVQDDWRVKPNLTISLGLRWESQTNVPDHNDWAPRVGFAWSPGGAKPGARPKTVFRGGYGFFYDRFAITNVEQAYRYNGLSQQTYSVDNPTIFNEAFDTPIPINELNSPTLSAAQKYQIDSALKIPRLMQTAIGMDRQLFARTTLGFNFVDSRGVHELRTVDINAPVPVAGALPPGAAGASNVCCRPYAALFPGDIYDYQSTGIFKQTQLLVNVNSQVGRWLTLFSRYSWGNAHSNTDGLTTLPSDPYNFAGEWGRSSLDIANTVFIGGSVAWKWGLRFSPFLVAHSGTPYNITTGTDLYLQGQGASTARPSISSTPTEYLTPFGYLNPDPLVGASDIIGRNAGTGPGFLGLNLRVSKTWGFGTTKFSGPSGGARAGGGGGRGGGGFGGGGPRGMGESTEHRYNVTLSVNARNILNHENLNTPNGALTSPYFMESTGITGGFGAESTASNQRRIDLQLRFSF